MPTEFRDDGVAGADAHVIDTGAPTARDLSRFCDETVAELARLDEGDLALRCDDTIIVRIAGERESGIGEREDEAAMGDTLSIDHVRPHRHRQRRKARADLDDLHAE